MTRRLEIGTGAFRRRIFMTRSEDASAHEVRCGFNHRGESCSPDCSHCGKDESRNSKNWVMTCKRSNTTMGTLKK